MSGGGRAGMLRAEDGVQEGQGGGCACLGAEGGGREGQGGGCVGDLGLTGGA